MIKLNDNNQYLIFYFYLNLNNIHFSEEFASKLLEAITLNIKGYGKGLTLELIPPVEDKVYVFLFDSFDYCDNNNNNLLLHYNMKDVGTYPFNVVMHSFSKFSS